MRRLSLEEVRLIRAAIACKRELNVLGAMVTVQDVLTFWRSQHYGWRR
jgi:hypothetical protein